MVGFDPALTICYRDEYKELLKDRRGDFEVLLPEEWLERAFNDSRVISFLETNKAKIKEVSAQDRFNRTWYLFAHCTENALVPRAVAMWQMALKHFNLDLLPIPVSCCGMAGMHGHMVQNQDESYKVWNMGWKKELEKRDFNSCLVTGFSCRSQVYRMEGKEAMHPIYVLLDLLLSI